MTPQSALELPVEQIPPITETRVQPHKENSFSEERLNYIGGTDCAAILGQSLWKTPLSVWVEKTRLLPPEDISKKMPVRVGIKLEDDVSELFMEETGKKLHRVNETIFHPKYPFIAANIDRRIVGEDAGFEAKTAAVWKSKEWEGEEMPMDYILQCFHYLMVTGKKRWYLGCLIGNQDFKWKVIERDEKLQAEILRREVEFWNEYVLPKIRPGVITKNDGDTLDRMFPSADPEKEIQLGDEANILVENLQALKSDQRNVENLIDMTENQLKILLEDANLGRTSLNEIRWPTVITNKFDVAAFKEKEPKLYSEYLRQKSTRRFSVKHLKPENKEG